jgi:hypothetical protein
VIVCGLVDTSATGPAAVLDEVQLGASHDEFSIEDIALSAVVKTRAGNPTVARCNSHVGDSVIAKDAKITALEVGTVTGP